MASSKITGSLYKVDAPQTNDKGYTTRTFVLFVKNERNEQYSDYIQFELFGDKCQLIDMYQPGQLIEVLFDIRGRKFMRKDGSGEGFFNSLGAYAILNPSNPQQYAGVPQQPQAPQTVIPGAKTQQAGYAQVMGQPQGDLPF